MPGRACMQDGWTLLHEAAASGHADAVTLLLAAGLDKDIKDQVWPRPCFPSLPGDLAGAISGRDEARACAVCASLGLIAYCLPLHQAFGSAVALGEERHCMHAPYGGAC